MKRIMLALLLLPGLLFGQAANDLILSQRNSGGTGNMQRNVGIGSAGQVLTSNGPGLAPSMQNNGNGTVTSVSFTGGLISVANPTTTPALTVAGTSGGIPYFSSTSTWATSALLAANSLMVGGGAGAAPATVTTGTGVLTALGVAVGNAGAFVTFNGALGIPSSGTVTNLTGTASININGTVGATTPTTGAFTTLANSALQTTTLATGGLAHNMISSNATGIYERFVVNAANRGYIGTGDFIYTGGLVADFGISVPSGTFVIAVGDVLQGYVSTTGLNAMNIGATTAGTGKFSALTDSGLVSGRVTFATTGGLLTDSASLTFNSGTGALTATSFVGPSSSSTLVATTATSTNASFYPLFVASSSNGNQAASLNSSFTFNPSTGSMSMTGSLTAGSGASTAGAVALTQGTTQSTGTNNVTLQAPAAVTSYLMTLPGAVGSTGLMQWTVSGSTATLSSVTTLPSGLTIPSPIFSTGNTASGSSANTWAGSSGTFITSTGANTISGAATFNSTITLGGTALNFGALPSGATTAGTLGTYSAQTYTVTGTNTATAFQAIYHGAPTFTDASAGTVTDLFSENWVAPVGAGSLVVTRKHTLGILDSTSAASSITGGFIVATAYGTTATSVGIGGGNINAGGTGTFGGAVAGTSFTTSGSGAGALTLTQGTTQSTGTTNITLQAPAAVTSYIRTLPGAVGSTGVVIETVSGSVQTESVVTAIPFNVSIQAPNSGLANRFRSNSSVTAQTPAATTRTYITGSDIGTITAGQLQVGTMIFWEIDITKTAAGTATSTFDIAFGTAGTTSDTARVSFTKPAGAAQIDHCLVKIGAVVKTNSASGVVIGDFTLLDDLANAGGGFLAAGKYISSITTTSGTFDTTTPTHIGLCITTGASDAYTINSCKVWSLNL